MVAEAAGVVWDSCLGCCSDLAAEVIAAVAALAEVDLVGVDLAVAADSAGVALVGLAVGVRAEAGRAVVGRGSGKGVRGA